MTTLRSLRLALLASLLSSFVALPAQDDPGRPSGAQPAGGPAQAPAPTLNLVFQGGPFGSLCDQLVEAGKAVGAKVNIVIDLEAARAEVPMFQVREAEVAQILEAACAASSRLDKQLSVENRRGSAASIYVITAHPVSQAPGTAVAREATAVHSLGALLKDVRGVGFAPETILSAIETATTELPLRALRYHTDSRLLVARGTQESLRVVAELLKELEQDVRRQEQVRKAAESHPGSAGAKASADQPKTGSTKDPAETR